MIDIMNMKDKFKAESLNINLQSQLLEKLKWEDSFRTGVWDQPEYKIWVDNKTDFTVY